MYVMRKMAKLFVDILSAVFISLRHCLSHSVYMLNKLQIALNPTKSLGNKV
jgi:hypothetical protein